MIRYLLILVALLAGGFAWADVFTPIDVNKQADVNGQTLSMPVLNPGTVGQPTRSQPVSPLTRKRAESGKAVETRRVDDLETLQFPMVETKVVPQANFSAKRAMIADDVIDARRVPTSNVEHKRATVHGRVIRPLTPAGEQELKDQFRKGPAPHATP